MMSASGFVASGSAYVQHHQAIAEGAASAVLCFGGLKMLCKKVSRARSRFCCVPCCGVRSPVGVVNGKLTRQSLLYVKGQTKAERLHEAFQQAVDAEEAVNGKRRDLEVKVRQINDQGSHMHVIYDIVERPKEPAFPPPLNSLPTATGLKLSIPHWFSKPSEIKDVSEDQVVDPKEMKVPFKAESAVNSATVITPVTDTSEIPGCLLALGLPDQLLELGFRDGNYVVAPWHGFSKTPAFYDLLLDGKIRVRCMKTGQDRLCSVVSVATHLNDPKKMHRLKGFGLDSVAIELHKDDWASLGAMSLSGKKRTNPFMHAYGYDVIVYGMDFGNNQILASRGHMHPDKLLNKHGLVAHTCNTEAGWSGAVLWSQVNGRLLWSGMHLGNWGNTEHNVGITVSAYGHLRKIAGLVAKTPKLSSQALDSLYQMRSLDGGAAQKMLDVYLSNFNDGDERELDITKLAPSMIEQIPTLESLSATVSSSSSTRTLQEALEDGMYADLLDYAEHGEEDYIGMSLRGDKKGLRHYKDVNDWERLQEGSKTTELAREEHGALVYSQEGEASTALASVVIPTFQHYTTIGGGIKRTRWADIMFDDESKDDQVAEDMAKNIPAEQLQRMTKILAAATRSEVPEVKTLVDTTVEATAELRAEPEPTQLPPIKEEETSIDSEGNPSPTQPSLADIQNMVGLQSLSTNHKAKTTDKMARNRLGFTHASYASEKTVISSEAELSALTAKEDTLDYDPIADFITKKKKVSEVAADVGAAISYDDLRRHPLLRDFWLVNDTTAGRKDLDHTDYAVDKNGKVMARKVAEIAQNGKGAATHEPQKFGDGMRDSLKAMEKKMRDEELASRGKVAFKEPLPELLEWDWTLPPTSSRAVKDSLLTQLKRLEAGGFSDIDILSQKIEEQWPAMMNRYSTLDVSGCLDELTSSIDTAFASLDLTRSTGWTSRIIPGTKSVWSTGNNRARIEEWLRCRILIHLALGPSLMGRMSPYLMVKSGCKDPEELFIKPEAHNPGKQLSKRWRLIWNPSLLDTLLLYVLHVKTNKQSLYDYDEGEITHQVLGMGHHDEGVQKLGAIIDSLYKTGEEVTTSDASGWDFSVRRDGFYLDAYRRIHQAKCRDIAEQEVLSQLLLCQAAALSSHVVAIGSELVEILHFGILSSGILSTGEINSFLRTFYAFCAGAVATMACSDDLVAAGRLNLAILRSFGIVDPKVDVVKEGEPMDFTSHLFVKVDGVWYAIYNNVSKLFNGLLLKNYQPDGTMRAPSAETASGHRFALRHNEYATWLYERIFQAFGFPLPEASPYSVAEY